MRFRIATVGLIALLVILPMSSFGRALHDVNDTRGNGEAIATATPAFCIAAHNVGKLVLAVNNNGTFGDGFAAGSASDCFTGFLVPSCEYPKRSGTTYLFAGAFWIGAVVGRDTLVSVGADGWQTTREMFPDEAPFGNMVKRSIIDPNSPLYKDAVSEQDYIAVYTDTFTSGVPGLDVDFIDGRPHRPLDIEVTQRSFAWSYPYAEDFVLFDYSIRSIGTDRLKNVYMGIYVDADVMPTGGDSGFDDDVCGFRQTIETEYSVYDCLYPDTVNIAWIADNDGELSGGGIFNTPLPNVTATRIVRTPSDSLEVSFNWWVSNGNPALDFGPQSIKKYRDFTTGGTGTPEGDRNKYAVLRNKEFDYDQVYTSSIQPSDETWLYPPQSVANDLSDGFDTRYLLSFGPFTIDPGQTLPISFAYVGGENFHQDPDNVKKNLQTSYNPDEYYANLHFSDLGLNSRWASWIYDNPGVDTDGDGYAGTRVTFNSDCTYFNPDDDGNRVRGFAAQNPDTVWNKGDNVPDFKGASPPPAPILRLEPSVGKILVRFNGFASETTRDVFSREYDFEGYRVYYGRDDRDASFTMVASYDIEDYNRLEFNANRREWELNTTPFTIEELDSLYGTLPDTIDFDPTQYSQSSPYPWQVDDSTVIPVYFEPQDFNRSEPGVTTPIEKTFPDAPNPIDSGFVHPDSVPANLRDLYLTEDGLFKYYEYNYTIENLLPTVPYFVNVTAFDFGSPQSDLPSLETSRTVNPGEAFPLSSVAEVEAQSLEPYVWPNPYRADGDYLVRGFEGRQSRYDPPIPDRERRVHFANLPPKCTIKIFSLDGDLVRQIDHDADPNDPTSMHESWDLITRNTQMVVSGIYYWTIERPDGDTKVGKLVIIM